MKRPLRLSPGSLERIRLRLPLQSIHIPLLITAVLAAWGATVLTATPKASFPVILLHDFSLGLFVVTVVGAGYGVIQQWIDSLRQPLQRDIQALWASMGACALATAAEVFSPYQSISWGISAALAISALVLFLYVSMVRFPTGNRTQAQTPLPTAVAPPQPSIQTTPQIAPVPPVASVPVVPPPAPVVIAPRIPLPVVGNPAPPVPLPPVAKPSTRPAPVFANDPLHIFPVPKKVKLFFHPKDSEYPAHSQDACALAEEEDRYALCDGVGGSRLPRPWATLLCQQWTKDPLTGVLDATRLARWLEQPRREWRRWVDTIWIPTQIARRKEDQSLPPFTPDIIDEIYSIGAATTFLGLTLWKTEKRDLVNWEAVSIGDTCLLVFSKDQNEWMLSGRSFPVYRSKDFNDHPPSIPWREIDIETLLPDFGYDYGGCFPGDVLVMATDALAKWILEKIEDGSPEWEALLTLNDPAAFRQFVEEQRSLKALETDDTTMIVIQIPNHPHVGASF